jgi:hypothetical protein
MADTATSIHLAFLRFLALADTGTAEGVVAATGIADIDAAIRVAHDRLLAGLMVPRFRIGVARKPSGRDPSANRDHATKHQAARGNSGQDAGDRIEALDIHGSSPWGPTIGMPATLGTGGNAGGVSGLGTID